MRRLWSATPDFHTGLLVFERYDHLQPADGEMDMWIEVLRGAGLAGLGDPRAGIHLGRAFQLSDRLGAANALDIALRALALIAARSGRQAQASLLIGYTDEHLNTYPRNAPFLAWLELGINEALEGFTERSSNEALGACTSRREIQEVAQLISELDDQ
jgi:hypothetical protein